MTKFKIGVLREEKSPPDKRVPLTPLICTELLRKYQNLEIVIQPSKIRCYSDDEYLAFGLPMQEDLSDCDLLMGVKEVPKEKLIPEKKYCFFSHTIKKQAHNIKLMKALIEKKIQMIDYETLTDKNHNRIIGFGRFAGIVGTYNGILGYGRKYDLFQIKPANLCRDRAEMEEELKPIDDDIPTTISLFKEINLVGSEMIGYMTSIRKIIEMYALRLKLYGLNKAQ